LRVLVLLGVIGVAITFDEITGRGAATPVSTNQSLTDTSVIHGIFAAPAPRCRARQRDGNRRQLR
jgi:hypothetical protein